MKQTHCKIDGVPSRLIVRNSKGDIEVVKMAKSNIFLGGALQDDLQWQEHIETGEDPLLAALRKKLGGLKFIGKHMPKKCKALLINGFLLSKVLYLLPIYGGTHMKYMKKLQIILNNAARFISGMGKRSSSRSLMEAIDWLNIQELMEVHTLNLAWRILRRDQPRNLAAQFEMDTEGRIQTGSHRIQNTERGLRC